MPPAMTPAVAAAPSQCRPRDARRAPLGSRPAPQYGLKIEGPTPRGVGFELAGGGGTGVANGTGSVAVAAGSCGSSPAGATVSSGGASSGCISPGWASAGADPAAAGAVGKRHVSCALSTQPFTPLFVLSTRA